MAVRGVETKRGWWVKASKEGVPFPLNSGLNPIFRSAKVITLGDAMDYAANEYGSKHCMGTRELLERKTYAENGKKFEKLRLGDYKFRSYKDAKESADTVGRALRSLGVNFGERIAIFAETRAEWFITAIGAVKQKMVVATLYTTLTDEGVIHGITEAEVQLLVTSYDLFDRVKNILNQCPMIKTIVVLEDQLDQINREGISNELNIVLYSELISMKMTPESKQINPAPEANDTAIIMYTSGSTGNPKGVELSHANILASVVAYSVQMNVTSEDRYLAYLPLAHIMELATEVASISLGITMYYSSPFTLSDNSAKIMKGCFGDAKVARPTVMSSVPLVLDRIIKGVLMAVEAQGWLKNLVFNEILRYKLWLDKIPLLSSILDYLIFNKIKMGLGGALKRLVIGGAPLTPYIHNTMRAIFGCHIQVGYGATETATCIAGMEEDDTSTGNVGGPTLGVILRFQNWEEGGYLTTDTPNPRGEILVGGKCVSKGYFRKSKETEEGFCEEEGLRWFKTGDIGEMNKLGVLRIIDRKKDLVKLKHGEYVSLGNTESKLKTLSIIENVCVFADSNQCCTVAVIIPSIGKLFSLAKTLGLLEESSAEDLCKNETIISSILKEIKSFGKKSDLSKWEIPAAIHLSQETWTPDSGLLTAAMKLRRKQLRDHYHNAINEMYSRVNS